MDKLCLTSDFEAKTSLKNKVKEGKSLVPLYSTGVNVFLWKYNKVGYPEIIQSYTIPEIS